MKEMQIKTEIPIFIYQIGKDQKTSITRCVGEDVSFIEGARVKHYQLLERLLAVSTSITDIYICFYRQCRF